MASLRSWLPGDVAPSVKTTALVEHGGARVGVTLTGIDPRLEVRVSKLASQMREGQLTDLSRAANGIIIGQALAEKLAVKREIQCCSEEAREIRLQLRWSESSGQD